MALPQPVPTVAEPKTGRPSGTILPQVGNSNEFRRPLKHRLSDLALAIATGAATAIVVVILTVILADVGSFG
jgi:hypothetical protein